jgi:hypothetical protein
MAKRIVQMLVTLAVDNQWTREEIRQEAEETLTSALIAHDVIVELVESRAHGLASPATTEGG